MKIIKNIPWKKILPIIFILIVIGIGIAHWLGLIDLYQISPATPYN